MNDETWHALRRKHKCKFTKRLRRKMTPEEKMLWEALRNRRFRCLKFRRQVNIGPFIVDFLCKQHRLIVEVDGGIHSKKERKEHDQYRDEFLRELNYSILRIKNDEIHSSLPTALDRIYNYIHPISPPLLSTRTPQATSTSEAHKQCRRGG